MYIREHTNDQDAHNVYQKVVKYCLTSTRSSIRDDDILSYITSSRLGIGKWKGSISGFIINWQEKVRHYEKQVILYDHFS